MNNEANNEMAWIAAIFVLAIILIVVLRALFGRKREKTSYYGSMYTPLPPSSTYRSYSRRGSSGDTAGYTSYVDTSHTASYGGHDSTRDCSSDGGSSGSCGGDGGGGGD
jgi:uncharacterized membrane protein YgcG